MPDRSVGYVCPERVFPPNKDIVFVAGEFIPCASYVWRRPNLCIRMWVKLTCPGSPIPLKRPQTENFAHNNKQSVYLCESVSSVDPFLMDLELSIRQET